mmetsp:Transcript_65991/g.143149  ORF Transcript_65991/g.143149 Transcript_65991/m.143149 type:complete len:88 (+) Transcript_65991:1680-1943(+)
MLGETGTNGQSWVYIPHHIRISESVGSILWRWIPFNFHSVKAVLWQELIREAVRSVFSANQLMKQECSKVTTSLLRSSFVQYNCLMW